MPDSAPIPRSHSISAAGTASRPTALLALLIALATSGAGSALATPSLEAVSIHRYGTRITSASLSADGRTVAGQNLRIRQAGDEVTTYLWTREDGYQALGELGPDAPDATSFTPMALSGDGSRVVGSLDDAPVVWDRGVGVTPLASLPGATNAGAAHGISDDGSTIVGSLHDGGVSYRTFVTPSGNLMTVESPRLVPTRWNRDGTAIEVLTDLEGAALDVSNNGIIVGEARLAAPLEDPTAAFRWDETTGQQLVPLAWPGNPFPWTNDVGAISADGTTLVGGNFDYFEFGSASVLAGTGYLWTGSPGSAETLPTEGLTRIIQPFLEGFNQRPSATATGVSADGSTVVGTYRPTDPWRGPSRPFVWSLEAGFQDLETLLNTLGVDTTDLELFSAFDVSADGKTLIGEGRIYDDRGLPSAVVWIAVIPEPSTALLIGVGLSLLTRERQRRS